MEVILRSDVEKLGLRGDVVDVKRGYARNYLLPRQLAEVFGARRQAVADQLVMFERELRTAAPDLTGLEPMIFQHCLTRLRAELTWHDELIARLTQGDNA